MAQKKHKRRAVGAREVAKASPQNAPEARGPEPEPEPAKLLGGNAIARDEAQVMRDVRRTALSEPEQQELASKVCRVLAKHPQLHYYQGFHEISQHCGSAEELEVLALTTLRDFMTPDMTPTLQVLDLIVPLMYKADRQLGRALSRVPAHFAVAPIITLFSHTFDRGSKAPRRIIERVQAHGLSHILYLYVALCLRNRQHLIQTDYECGSDWSLLHSQLVKLHLLIGDYSERELAELSLEALSLAKRYPLCRLREFDAISPHSSLRSRCKLQQAAEHAKVWLPAAAAGTKRTSSRTLHFAVAAALVVVGYALQKQR